ncbi:golgi to er traffic protein 4 like protein [Quercus suber]|uniref:Golgi to er traffic protein 4 like protein n=1 Tax=Quercus suber TaxID=58331 RepID=A0AAW0L4L8_QUESU
MSRERPKRGTLPLAQENIEKLQKVVEEGNYYGAQQMYKSISARYVSAQRYSEALDILQSGACIQLKHGQITCGAELAVLFVETLVKGKIPYYSDAFGKFTRCFLRFLCHNSCQMMMKWNKFLKPLGQQKYVWSVEFGAHRSGSPEQHVMLAEYIYSESPEVDMARVSNHFVRGNSPKKFASVLVNFMRKCYPGEDDLAIARAILMFLAMGNLRDANYLMDEIKKQLESNQLDFPQSDLIQFIIYLLQIMQRDALPLFNMLQASYKTSIEREPAFNELQDEIVAKFYGVRRRNPLQGVFGDIFMMMGGE